MRRSLFNHLLPRRKVARRAAIKFHLERLEERSLLSTGLVAAYSFNEGSGSAVYDSSGYGNNGTISQRNLVDLRQVRRCSVVQRQQCSCHCQRLVVIGSHQRNDIGSMGRSLHREQCVARRGVQGKQRAHQQLLPRGDFDLQQVPRWRSLLSSGTNVEANGTTALNTSTWTFLAETYNGSNLISLRQRLAGGDRGTCQGSILTSTAGRLHIGGDCYFGHYFSGLIDNVRDL